MPRLRMPYAGVVGYNWIYKNCSKQEVSVPIYEYVCEGCKTRFERIVHAKNGAPECPKCGGKRSTVQFSTFAARTGNGRSSSATSGESAGASSCGCTPHSCGCH